MADLFDYLAWRGDLSFGNAPLCPVDGLIFSAFSYLRTEEAVPASFTAGPVRIADAAEVYFSHPEQADVMMMQKNNDKLFRAMADSHRFGNLRLTGARRIFDRESGVQFAAVTVLLPGQNLFVAFEGTDDTFVGWREDFRMSYECPVPAQLRAVEYLREAAASFPLRRIFVGGHSKGGNLAMYAAVYCGAAYRPRIRRVFNFDGPGFCDDTRATPPYLELRDRISTFLPQSAVVGFLLDHDDRYQIVKSTGKGLLQHNPYTWEVLGPDFVFATERTAFGKKTEAILDRFVNELSPERKRQFTEALFTVLEAADRSSVSDLNENKLKSARDLYRAYASLPPDVREILNDAFASLRRSARDVLGKNKKEIAPKNA